ncbi:hypothetical protein TSL6_05630 [Sulfurovum sp. TSL6]|uniref:hypothetical protein n=1 Tax=Sulfurovum sp. TSL6 TaxID=2826995 RepID=UPI001CC75B27|nr:hypothetical protein [Sulfurovum sp. TSL6]GIU00057.1 hypothetical protein TSL6_05630 [Sulfurovum sp. TSL6]
MKKKSEMFDFSILPLRATIVMTSNVLLLALLFPLVTLAKVTSVIILFVLALGFKRFQGSVLSI